MASHTTPRRSTRSQIQLYVALLCQPIAIFSLRVLPRAFQGWPIRRCLAVSFLQARGWLSLEQSRFSNPPTGKAIKKLCLAKRLPCERVDVPCGETVPAAALYFIRVSSPSTSAESPQILLYFHGGGYRGPITNGHIDLAFACAEASSIPTIVLMEYTLAPELPYPGQLIQAVEAVRFLLRTYIPRQIILAGDSAGGNLVLAVLAHLQQPSPYICAIEGISGREQERISAVVLISPWVACEYDAGSFAHNKSKDYIDSALMKQLTALWKPVVSDVWAVPLLGTVDFWRDVPVENMLVTAGNWECFHDDIKEMATRLGAKEVGSGEKVELMVAEREVHVQFAVDAAMKLAWRGSARKILDWLASRRK